MIVTSRVRLARPGDADGIMAMLREMHAETGMMGLSEKRVEAMIGRAFSKTGGATIGVIGPPGKLEASICLLISSIWYSHDFHLEELWNFVRAPYRGVRDNAGVHHVDRLVEFAKRCGDETALPVLIGIMSGIRTEAKVRKYRRLLGEPIGAFFLHRPHAGARTSATAELTAKAGTA